MAEKLQQAWYSSQKWVWCLFPLMLIFWGLSTLRRSLYKLGIKTVTTTDIPVIVVGNIGVGGNGKTPLVIALVEALTEKGYHPAVLSRGYGGQQSQFPYAVTKDDSAIIVGDEPALIATRLGCDVVIDPKRVRGVQYIIENTSANVVICDDGLQHYAMGRDVELCVVDQRGLGNGFLLPMGPLREGKWRLNKLDAVIINQGVLPARQGNNNTNIANNLHALSYLPAEKIHAMQLAPQYWVNMVTHEHKSLNDFSALINVAISSKRTVIAMAGIGHPKRFFDTLSNVNIEYTEALPFADHHQFTKADLAKEGILLMTEKDAVKCFEFAHENCWYLPVNGVLPEVFFDAIEQRIATKAKQFIKSRA